ncbi:MAG TPA: SatD family protein [Thermotogota bacterium]|nr:SatD family protein [Thermotogota bacterium]
MPVVVTADIIASRKQIEETRNLKAKIHDTPFPGMAMPFLFLRGDEIQGVLREPFGLGRALRDLRHTCFPSKVRIGIGVGAIDTPEESWESNSWLLSGEAFYYARDALNAVKKRKEPVTSIKTGNADIDLLLNSVLSLVDVIRNDWTQKQWQSVLAYEKHHTFEKAGKTLGLPYQNVFKHCERANWKEVRSAEEALERFLSDFHTNP